jgi:hypothetical protein
MITYRPRDREYRSKWLYVSVSRLILSVRLVAPHHCRTQDPPALPVLCPGTGLAAAVQLVAVSALPDNGCVCMPHCADTIGVRTTTDNAVQLLGRPRCRCLSCMPFNPSSESTAA